MKKLFCLMLLGWGIPAWADLQTDMMNDKIDRLDREMTLLQKKVFGQGTIKMENGTVLPADIYTQLEEQNRIIADLTAKTEELTNQVAVLKEQMDKMQADTDLRFQEKEEKTDDKPDTKAEKSAEKADVKVEKLTDKEAYDKAYNLLIKAKYPEAEQAFIAFLKDYPESNLVGNANYWLGETYYVRGQYEVAAGIFSDGLTKYEKSTKAPDNLLKLGLTMANLNKKEDACGFFKLMPEQFPKAGATLKQRAEQEAKKLACP